MSGLWIKFWGVRGSIPVPGPHTVKYGGNTSCMEMRSDEGDWLIFDAGSGLRVLGDTLDFSRKHAIHILISHPHWDHINGFPFFTPIYIPGNKIDIYGPSTHEMTIEDIINGQMKYSYFPVRTAELQAEMRFHELKEEEFSIGNFSISTHHLNHPVTCLGYRVRWRDKIFVYLGDNEPYYNVYNDNDPDVENLAKDMNQRLVEFVRGADALVTDATYTPAEYSSHRGWGHSTTHDVVNMAIKGGVRRLFFYHHEPQRTDEEMDLLVEHYRARIAAKGFRLEVYAAAEGARYEI